jgi:hypothetical protein
VEGDGGPIAKPQAVRLAVIEPRAKAAMRSRHDPCLVAQKAANRSRGGGRVPYLQVAAAPYKMTHARHEAHGAPETTVDLSASAKVIAKQP